MEYIGMLLGHPTEEQLKELEHYIGKFEFFHLTDGNLKFTDIKAKKLLSTKKQGFFECWRSGYNIGRRT